MEKTANTLLSFEYNNLRGGSKSLKDYQGKLLCVIFISPYTINNSMELVSEISAWHYYGFYEGKNIKFVFMALCINYPGDSPALRRITVHHNKIDCLSADDNVSETLMLNYRLFSMPQAMIIAPDGAILDTMEQPYSGTLDKKLKKLLL
ncbi:hypothetical protein ACX0HA_01275 [Flavobacterium hauense]